MSIKTIHWHRDVIQSSARHLFSEKGSGRRVHRAPLMLSYLLHFFFYYCQQDARERFSSVHQVMGASASTGAIITAITTCRGPVFYVLFLMPFCLSRRLSLSPVTSRTIITRRQVHQTVDLTVSDGHHSPLYSTTL